MRILSARIAVACLLVVSAVTASAANLRTMNVGLGTGTVTSAPAGINCGATCDAAYGATVSVTLTATAGAGSTFVGWGGDCAGAGACVVFMNSDRSVRAEFALTAAIPVIADFTPAGLQAYLTANPAVNTPARFVKALPVEFRRNWLLMSRSESLQTGTAETPRILLPSADSRFVFTFGLKTHSAYPGAHPNAIEYMQWDATEKNFRFHELVLDSIPVMGTTPARTRGVAVDDARCFQCHSTRNVLNRTALPGTTGIPVGSVKAKNKPNWDTYDSWGGMLPLNRDRIFQGSVEAAAFRKIFNPWTWRTSPSIRALIEQLELQPPGVPAAHSITRVNGGPNDGHIIFGFDVSPPVLTEPAPVGTSTSSIAYSFDGVAGGAGTTVQRGGTFLTLHHSADPTNDEGRGVQLFDLLGGADGSLNQQRVADELISHRFATGSVPIDVRPIALAITKDCVTVSGGAISPAFPAAILSFFDSRNGMNIGALVTDTRSRAQNLTRRRADIQKINLDRTGDVYLIDPDDGLIQEYGAATAGGTSTATSRIRQDVFRRLIDAGSPDATVMGGFYVDREVYAQNTNKLALYRYFLEPLGVSVDKWSMGVRGRSRTYTFADIFSGYLSRFTSDIEASLTADPFPGLASPYTCASLITAVNNSFAALPPANAVPTFTDVQRIFNKACIECHGGLGYPPFEPFFPATYLDFSEDEAATVNRLARSHTMATTFTSTNPATSYLFQRITDPDEDCPNGVMPCGGPPLSKVDVETIRRWIVGGRPSTVGDPHIQTIDGTNYDFQSDGEFVLLRGENLEIQARQTAVPTAGPLGPNAHTGLTACVSINTAAAFRVGPHRISYQPDLRGEPNPDGLQLHVDGKLTPMGRGGIALSSGGRILSTTAPGGIQIEYPGGTDIVVTPGWWDHHQVWYLNIDVRHARATEGVMGAIAPGNWLPALPDGTFLGPRPADLARRYEDLYVRFANAWRVSDDSSLFTYAPGTSTKTFTLASWPGFAVRSCLVPRESGRTTQPPAQPLPPDVAQRHCRGLVDPARRANCVQDVMITGEAGFAETYLLAQEIERNVLPAAPVLRFPENDKTDLAGTLSFDWKKTLDLAGDRLTYRLCVWEAGTTLTFANCKPLPMHVAMLDGRNTWIALLLLAILLLLMIFLFIRMGRFRILFALLAIAILLAAYFAWRTGTSPTLSSEVAGLKPGTAYFWKVITEDGKGGTVESETRRFATKK